MLRSRPVSSCMTMPSAERVLRFAELLHLESRCGPHDLTSRPAIVIPVLLLCERSLGAHTFDCLPQLYSSAGFREVDRDASGWSPWRRYRPRVLMAKQL